jgi:hypothetical protein
VISGSCCPTWSGLSRRKRRTEPVPSVAARRTKGLTWAGFQVWACVAHVDNLRAMLASIYVADPSRFSYRSAKASRKDDWICGLTMSEVWAIPDRLPLRDFISGVRDCTHGRLITDPGVTGGGPPAGSSGPPQNLGPSGDRLANALEVSPPRGGGDRGAEPSELAVDADDLADIFDRPSSATFFGIGDSDDELPRTSSEDSPDMELSRRPREA